MAHDLPTFDTTSQHYPFLCSTEELSVLTRMFMRICTLNPSMPQRRLLIPILGWRSLIFARLASPGSFVVDGELIVTPVIHVQTVDGRDADWLEAHAIPGGFSLWGASAQEALAEVKPTHVALIGTSEEVRQAYLSLRHCFTKGLSLHTDTTAVQTLGTSVPPPTSSASVWCTRWRKSCKAPGTNNTRTYTTLSFGTL